MPDSQSSEPGFESCFATVSKIGHFRSLHWRPCWLSCINEYLAWRVIAAWLECFPEKPSWCRNEQVCQGGQKVKSALSGPTDWILHYIKTTFTFYTCLLRLPASQDTYHHERVISRMFYHGLLSRHHSGCLWWFGRPSGVVGVLCPCSYFFFPDLFIPIIHQHFRLFF